MPYTVLIVDDHDIIRYGLRCLFEASPDLGLEIVGETDYGRMAVELAVSRHPDLVIMDLALPALNGIEASSQIHKQVPESKIIALSMYNDRRSVREMIKAGVGAYVLKNNIFNDLIDAIHAVLAGEIYLSPKLVYLVMKDYKEGLSIDPGSLDPLTDRQKKVLQLIAEGKSNKEIAALLHLGVKAVESTRHRIMTKLGIDHVAGLTKYAIQEGLTRTES